MNNEEQISEVIKRLGSEKLPDRVAAFRDVLAYGDEATEQLIQALNDKNDYIRSWASQLLGKIGTRKAIPALREVIKDENGDVRAKAIQSLALFQQAGIPIEDKIFLNALSDSDQLVKATSVSALGSIGSRAAVQPLTHELANGSYQVREAAAFALGEIGDTDAVPSLIEALQDSYVWVRVNAVNSLGKIRDTRAMPSLTEATHDPDPEVSQRAIQALRRIKQS